MKRLFDCGACGSNYPYMFRLVNCPDPANYVTDGTDEVGNKTSVFSGSQMNGSLVVSLLRFSVGGGVRQNATHEFRWTFKRRKHLRFKEIQRFLVVWLPHWLPLEARRHRDYSFKCSASASLCPAWLRGEAAEKSPTILAMKKNWMFRGFVGDKTTTQLYNGLFHEAW